MATVIQTDIGAILQAIETRLVSTAAVDDAAQVLWVAQRDEPPHASAQKDVLLRVGRMTPRQPWNDGGGRYAVVVSRVITVYCRMLDLQGPGYSAKEFLKALDPFEALVLSALQDFFPEDGSGNALLTEPMRLLDGEPPMAGAKDSAWGDVLASYEVCYLPVIDTTDPG